MLSGLTGVRRKFRTFYQKIFIITILIALSIFIFSYLNLEFCYKILAQSTLNHMCWKYKDHEYSGALCDELCNSNVFKDFKCPQHEMKTIIFTAIKNNDLYAVKMAGRTKNELTWTDRDGVERFPKLIDFKNSVKTHIIVSYNITLDDSVLQALLSQEIDTNNPEQMRSFWRLFKDNNYMMCKLYDEEDIFPTIFGSCGPYYATENLNSIQPETGLKHYITIDWEGRLEFALIILDYLYRLETVKPDPLKMCKIEPKLFGMASNKRVKYQSAQYIRSESQLDKYLASGTRCHQDKDCLFGYCIGKCDLIRNICNGIQQNNNMQIVCQHIFKGTRLFPGLLSTAKTPPSLMTLIDTCVDPTKNPRNHLKDRVRSPTQEVGIKLYNEIKRIYNEITMLQ